MLLQLIISLALAFIILISSFLRGRKTAKENYLKNFIVENEKLKEGKDKFNNFSKSDKFKWLFDTLAKRKKGSNK